jgi:hypothetical protein
LVPLVQLHFSNPHHEHGVFSLISSAAFVLFLFLLEERVILLLVLPLIFAVVLTLRYFRLIIVINVVKS